MVKYDYTYQLGKNEGSSATSSNQYIILHDTGNANNVGTNSAQNEASYMHGHWGNAYTHAIAGWDRVYIIGEPGYVAYGAGSPANERSPFQIELARYSDKSKALAAYKNWIDAAVTYAKKYGIPRTLDGSGKGIKSHKWVSDNLWGDHQDPYAYLKSIGISKAQLAKDLAAGKGSAPATTATKPAASKPAASKAATVKKVDVSYGLRQGKTWLPTVKNFGSGSNGFAGLPYKSFGYLFAKVSRGKLWYQVHTLGGGWLPKVYKGDPSDLVSGAAGNGKAIDGIRMYYTTPAGETPQQVYYRVQTTKRQDYLGVCCDDGTSIAGFDGWAGILGEPIDHVQMAVAASNPF